MSEFYKYTIANISVFILDLVLLVILTELFDIFYIISASISLSLGFTFNYLLNTTWVFSFRKYADKPVYEYIIMALISVFVGGINILGIWILSEHLNFNYLLSKFFISFFTMVVKFILRRNILFRF